MLKISVLFLSILFTTNISAKLLDKIAGIVDDNVITLSQLNRMSQGIAIKKSIAPMIYDHNSFTSSELLNININKYLIRTKLTELGYAITDDQVEAQIKSNEKRLGVDRNSLMGFLKQQNTTFDEYFETLREAIEYSYFISRVISPLISIPEQDVKNTFFKKNSKDVRMNFKYTLIDYSISKSVIQKLDKVEFEKTIKQYRTNSVLPENYSTMLAANLDDITEDGMAQEMVSLLKNTDEGSLSAPIVLNGSHHVFFVSKKDLVESEAFTKQKDKIRDELFEAAVKTEAAVWFERERNKHYIKISI